MPRKRKEETDAGPSAKRSRTTGSSLEIDGQTVHWQWENDGENWTSYNSEMASTITDGYIAGKRDVSFDVAPNVAVKVMYEKMVQKNKKTGWERRLRCAVKNSTNTGFHVWQWEDEHNKWNPFNMKTTVEIEKASEEGTDEIDIQAGNRKYTINLNDMEQVNKSTKVSRKIKSLDIKVSKESLQFATSTEPTPTTSDDTTEDVSVSKSKSGTKGSTGRAKSGKKASGTEEASGSGDYRKSGVRTIILKGAAPVDPECTQKVKTSHVYSKGKDIYDTMLNQTNLSNNNNKYYLIQLLEDDNRKAYNVWLRWGRVGYKGQTNLIPCGPDLDDAIDIFCKKFHDKTRNDWTSRSKFSKVSGKYDMVTMDYSKESSKGDDEVNPKKTPENVPDSKLERKLQSLIDLICDVRRMEDAVVEMKYDAKKAPLGKLTEKQIKAGYSALQIIDNCIYTNDFGSKLIQACDDFYTRIPHDFGMTRPPVIRTKKEVMLKLQLLEALSDIEIAMKIIKQSKVDENPLDTHYNSLNCGITALDKSMADYKMVEDYLQNTHAATHNQYKMKIIDMFDIDRHGENDRFVDKGNRMLLWHGSRLTNWVGILSQGLKIAPPEAPVTGYMFGKGVYFADMSSKSANYCYPSQSKSEGLILLCEVSLGKSNELLAANYKAASLPSGTHSVYAKGEIAPNPKKNFKMSNGCIVPIGKGVNTGVNNPSGYTLNYNEFIVYDLKQIKMKYLLRIKFNF